MTRPQGFDVRVAPDVVDVLSSRRACVGLAQQFGQAMRRLEQFGTRATGAKKLAGLDPWEIRAGEHRAYFCPVPGKRVLAVGALIPKKAKRHRSARLLVITARVHRWREAVQEEHR